MLKDVLNLSHSGLEDRCSFWTKVIHTKCGRCIRAGNIRLSEAAFGRKGCKVKLSSQTITIQKQSHYFESCHMGGVCMSYIWVTLPVVKYNFFFFSFPASITQSCYFTQSAYTHVEELLTSVTELCAACRPPGMLLGQIGWCDWPQVQVGAGLLGSKRPCGRQWAGAPGWAAQASQPHTRGCWRAFWLGCLLHGSLPVPLCVMWCLTLMLRGDGRHHSLWDCSHQATLLPWPGIWDPPRLCICVSTGGTSTVQSFREIPGAETPGAPSPARSFLLCGPSPLRLPSACSQERAVEPHTLPCCGRRQGRLPRVLGEERNGAAEVGVQI